MPQNDFVETQPGVLSKTTFINDFILAELKISAGTQLDYSFFNDRERKIKPEFYVGSIPSAPHIMSGILAIIPPTYQKLDALLITPEFGYFRYDVLQVNDDYKFVALTDVELNCFSMFTKRAYKMYKIENFIWNTPQTLTSEFGLFVCVTGGSLSVNGVTYVAGQKIPLGVDNITFTPVTNEVKVSIVADRNQRPPESPMSVSPRQIRQALSQVGMRDAVEAAVAGSPQDIKDWWEFATVFERNNKQVVDMATALGLTAAQTNDLFNLAASL